METESFKPEKNNDFALCLMPAGAEVTAAMLGGCDFSGTLGK